jgi:hypothetical protein
MDAAIAASTAESTTGSETLLPVFAGPTDIASWIALTCRLSRCGNTCSSFASARALLSSIPTTPRPARRPIATATASSSSSGSGGSFAPAPNW